MLYTSPKVSFDHRLLAIEEQFRQRRYQVAISELSELSESEFGSRGHDNGLYHSLRSEASFFQTNYRQALEFGLKAARYLADLPLNRQYGRVQWVLSKAYSAMGDLRNADIRARDALAAFRRASDSLGQIDALNELARIAFIRNDYKDAVAFLEEALPMVGKDERKRTQLIGNLGRIRIQTGEWAISEQELGEAIEKAAAQGEEMSLVANYLSLGKLHIRRRQFTLAGHRLDDALEIISRLSLKREKIIYLEFAGDLAFQKGDAFKAKSHFSDAYQRGMALAPDSALVSQSGRRLAEAELVLDNIDDAMKYGQKALEVALMLGEKGEIGLAKRVIAQVFAARGDFVEALDAIRDAVEILRNEGDPYHIARALMAMAEIKALERSERSEKILLLYDEAYRIFKKLKLDYWMAETEYQAGVLSCQHGNLSRGFKRLNRAEKVFAGLNDKVKVRAVNKFLKSLSEQAVALSVSSENEFKAFGNLITPAEYSDIKSNSAEEILNVLLRRTGADRAIIYSPEFEDLPVVSSVSLTSQQVRRFADGFGQLLGEEVSKKKPTLILDCRRDPYINELFADSPDVVASVMVVPIRMSDETTSYLYAEKLSKDNSLNPFSQTELNFAVGFSDLVAFKWAEVQKNRLLEDNLRLKRELQESAAFPNMITRDDAMLDVLAQVRQVVNSSISLSIEGETGTGKDLLARAIHYNSDRRDKRFISVNCAALPEPLLESELFGYRRGAFTGADRDKVGLFEEADGGTFFLDEIADMPLSIQANLLRVLENKEIVRLGDTVSITVDVRIVSATNRDLKEAMNEGQFRQDLYYRLTALTFRLPALRERRSDIPLLIQHFLRDSSKTLSPEVMKFLVAYDWPGNVRELENEVKKLVLLSGDSEEIGVEAISSKFGRVDDQSPVQPTAQYDEEMVFDPDYSLYDFLAGHEKRFIVKALQEKLGVKKHAAALLNIPESTLRLKIKQYDIDINQIRPSH